jgi:hypothetical protein
MSKYTFICEHTDLYGKLDGNKITHEVTQESLMSVLESFEQFLRGVGFYFDGHLDVVEEEIFTEDEPQEEEEHEWTQTLRNDNEWPFPSATPLTPEPEMYEAKDVMEMPGTIGGAKVILSDTKCPRCGLTQEQLGSNICYDENCGLKI